MHAEIKIGDSVVMLSDEWPNSGVKAPVNAGCATASLMIYLPDVDASFERAINAGAKSTMAVQDMFWGDRAGQITDPYGHKWMLSTHIEDVAPADMERRQQEFLKKMSAA